MFKLLRLAPVFLFAVAISPAYSQTHKVPLQKMHERLLCVVPMVGAGTPEDPRRPMFAPLPEPGEPPSRDGIIAFTFQESDDGRYALVEFVARDRKVFDELTNSKRAEIQVFQRGKDKRQDIEREFRKHKQNFNLDRLEVGAL